MGRANCDLFKESESLKLLEANLVMAHPQTARAAPNVVNIIQNPAIASHGTEKAAIVGPAPLDGVVDAEGVVLNAGFCVLLG